MEEVIIVKGRPRGKERPRVVNRQAFTPMNTKVYEEQVKWAWIAQSKKKKLTGAIKVTVVAHFRVPKKEKHEYGEPYLHKPDGDNILKIVLDALNGLAYDDDNQIFNMNCRKVYDPEDEFVAIFLEEEKQ